MSKDAHEELVERVAIAISGAPYPSARSLNKARTVIAIIAEETKEPSAIMEDTASVLPSTRMLSRAFWISMHRVSALWPRDAQS